MDFIVKDGQGTESAPLTHNEVEQLIINGKINGDTPIRNTMINKWNTISEIGLFTDTIAYAEQKLAQEDPETAEKIREDRKVRAEKNKEAAYGTAYRNRIEPVPGGLVLRGMSALTDLLVVAIIAGIIGGAGWVTAFFHSLKDTTYVEAPAVPAAKPADAVAAKPGETPAPAANGEPVKPDAAPTAAAAPTSGEPTATKADTAAAVPGENFSFEPGLNNDAATEPPTNLDNLARHYNAGSKWTMADSGDTYCCISSSPTKARWVKAEEIHSILVRSYVFFWLAVILYFGIAFGIYAQTGGMWFWGLFVAKADGGEAYMLRALVYTVLMLLLGWLMPLMIFLRRRAIHDRLAGVSIFKTSGTREF